MIIAKGMANIFFKKRRAGAETRGIHGRKRDHRNFF